MKFNFRIIGYIAVILYVIGIFAVAVSALNYTYSITRLWKEMPILFYLATATNLLGLLAFIGLISGVNTKTELIYISNEEFNQSNLQNTEEQKQNSNEIISTHSLEKIKNVFTEVSLKRNQTFEKTLRIICEELNASVGALYINEDNILSMYASYALYQENNQNKEYKLGEGLVGQVAKNGKMIKLTNVPEDYLPIVSGLGKGSPSVVLLLPIMSVANDIVGVVELAGFQDFTEGDIKYLENVALLLAKEIEWINI
jgi:putative methionine-R-sulfoxide reductase with GAF domain